MTEAQKRRGAPSGGQTGSMAAGGSGPAQLEGEDARRAYPAQVEAALAYAAENKYEYGPKFRNLELTHTVVNARLMTRDIVRVTIEYRPKSKFSGASGSEYFDVDSSGAILARRQIRVPKESMPWVLMGIATLSVLAAAALVPFMLLYDGGGNPLYVSGRTLWILSEEPRSQPYIYYTGPDINGVMKDWVVVPEGEDTEMVMVELTVINQTSGSVTLLVDEDAAQLQTTDGLTVRPINILQRAGPPQTGPGHVEPSRRMLVPGFVPMWGNTVLEEDHQLKGFLVFEVPVGSEIDDLRWSATDVATIPYN